MKTISMVRTENCRLCGALVVVWQRDEDGSLVYDYHGYAPGKTPTHCGGEPKQREEAQS